MGEVLQNISRKVKSGYIGVSGVARQFFNNKQYLIKDGQINSEISFNVNNSGNGAITYNSDNIHLALTPLNNTAGNYLGFYTANPIDLSGFTKACIRCSFTSCFRYQHDHTDGFGFKTGTPATWNVLAEQPDCYALFEDDATNVTISLDISSIMQDAYCSVVLNNQSKYLTGDRNQNQIWIYDIWLE